MPFYKDIYIYLIEIMFNNTKYIPFSNDNDDNDGTFGFRQRDLYRLLRSLHNPETIRLANNSKFSNEEMLLLCLYRYKSADELNRICITFSWPGAGPMPDGGRDSCIQPDGGRYPYNIQPDGGRDPYNIQQAFYNGWKSFHGRKNQSVELPNTNY
jgi:hypothetical protein